MRKSKIEKTEIVTYLEEKADLIFQISDKIWDYAETKFQEHRSADALIQVFRDHGFTIEENCAGMKTAFIASYGRGTPVIGLLGEYDALSAMSQKADCFSAQSDPSSSNGNGHGCGHNLLGAGALGAALAVKKYLEHNETAGIIKFFGCPGEEGGSGKTFLVREGYFKDVDIALTWHPSDYNGVTFGSSLALAHILYQFDGISAHAAISPENGRSALDGAELMNVGSNFLREHICQEARLHYAFLDAGGTMTNVVPNHAQVLYTVRAPESYQVNEIVKRLDKIARGAAMMTETEVTITFKRGVSNLIPNQVLGQVLQKNMEEIACPVPGEADRIYGENMEASMNTRGCCLKELVKLSQGLKDTLCAHYQDTYHSFVIPYMPVEKVQAFSTDVGDVSCVCPTAQIGTATWVSGSLEHTWQITAQGKSTMAHAGTLYAAKILAAAAVDLFHSPEIIHEAAAEFNQRTKGHPYVCPIPPEVKA